jgi:hypothetical protein
MEPMWILFLALLGIGGLLMLIGSIWLIVCAFQEGLVQGLLYLFVPIYPIVFVIMYWQRAGNPLLLTLVGAAVFFGSFFVMPTVKLPDPAPPATDNRTTPERPPFSTSTRDPADDGDNDRPDADPAGGERPGKPSRPEGKPEVKTDADKLAQLIKDLEEGDAGARNKAAFALGRMGAAAKAAIPALEQAAVNDDDESVRAAAKFALNSIRN